MKDAAATVTTVEALHDGKLSTDSLTATGHRDFHSTGTEITLSPPVHVDFMSIPTRPHPVSLPSPQNFNSTLNRPHKDLFLSPFVQRLTEYGLSCNEKYITNLGCIIS